MNEMELKQQTDQTIDQIDTLSNEDAQKVNGGVATFFCPAGMSLTGDVVLEYAPKKEDHINYSTAEYACKNNMRPRVKQQ